MNKLQTISNDAIGRRTEINRSGTKMTETRSDAYGYNDRSELTNAVKNATLNEYAYQYDDIGNRETSVGDGWSYPPARRAACRRQVAMSGDLFSRFLGQTENRHLSDNKCETLIA